MEAIVVNSQHAMEEALQLKDVSEDNSIRETAGTSGEDRPTAGTFKKKNKKPKAKLDNKKRSGYPQRAPVVNDCWRNTSQHQRKRRIFSGRQVIIQLYREDNNSKKNTEGSPKGANYLQPQG